MGANRKYTDEQLLEILRNEASKCKNLTCEHFTAKNGLPSWSVYRKRFGSFNNAKILAGISETINVRYDSVHKENVIDDFLKSNKGRKCPMTASEFYNTMGYNCGTITKMFGSYDNLVRECGYIPIKEGFKISKKFLLDELLRFCAEEERIPRSIDFEKQNNRGGYPNRKTYDNHFGSVTNALIEAGILEKDLIKRVKKRVSIQYCKLSADEIDELKDSGINFLIEYKNKYGKPPTTKELDSGKYGIYTRSFYRNLFGSYTNAVREAGLKPNSIPQYEDEFLKSEFERFIKTNGRVPMIHEFNNSEYPSFWCYQSRYGSWNKAVMHYGYEPNDSNRKYYMDDGEICTSSYEFDISTWLRKNNIKYDRNVSYKDIHNKYSGKMDCDYKIYYKDKVWFVEMAGFLSEGNKLSEVERIYFFKMKYKEKLLKESNVNYLIIRPRHLKKKTMEEIFKPIFENKLKEEC